jgi:putative spermidine/putrescine transport system permease protein
VRDDHPPRTACHLLLPALVAVFLLMPLIAVIPVSFTPTRYLSVPDGEWSLRHYQALIDNPAWGGAWPVDRHRCGQSVLATSLGTGFQPWHLDVAATLCRGC